MNDIPYIDPCRGIERFHIDNKHGVFTVQIGHPFGRRQLYPDEYLSVAVTAWPFLILKKTGAKTIWSFAKESDAQEMLAWLKDFIFNYWFTLYKSAGRNYEQEMKYLDEPRRPYG